MPLPDRFADLHCHPSFKAVLMKGRGLDPQRSAWHALKLGAEPGKTRDRVFMSQSCLSQLHAGRVNLVVAPVYGLERAFTRSNILQLVAALAEKIDHRFIQDIKHGKHAYVDLMRMDLNALNAFPTDPNNGGQHARVLSSIAEFDPDSSDVQVILALEGGHNFYGRQANGDDDVSLDTIHHNLDEFKQPGGPRALYLTPTHLARNVFGNHCYGVKMIRDQEFFPNGHGLTPMGRDLIARALDTSDGRRRILIDIKHMSLQMRIDFYRMRWDLPGGDRIPILCSHAGVTGISQGQVFRYVDGWYKPLFQEHINVRYIKPKGIDGCEFNPWSINLYDEDIYQIIASRGIIGLSLDERILGSGRVAMERMSPLEAFKPSRYQMTFLDDRETEDGEVDVERTVKQLCATLLHVVRIGTHAPNADPWDHVCLGSDYDGLINAVNPAPTAESMGELVRAMAAALPPMAQRAGIAIGDVEEKLHRFFFGNMLRFLRQHFN